MALFKDIFYPGNPERRRRVERLYQEIIDCMKDNFYATNKLVGYLKQNFSVSSGVGKIVHGIDKLEIRERKTIKENCDIFLAATTKLQDAVRLLNENLARELEPSAYRALKDTGLGFVETIRQLSQWSSVITMTGASVAAVIIICRITSGAILGAMVAEIGMIASCSIAGVVVVAIGLGVDAILSAIFGAIEREKLENAIKELETTKSTFEPATREYTQTIYEILGAIKHM
ncbi:single-pass membrane and coiled-coil domain-containing protein 3-like [Rhopilema esculentum]|uniref:single-pass membrane and coiled-coil domain-containing protein 3-like n=1 Tax=Rhopilema esculentum TaxID=499914 RepID=UPI0031CEF6FC|eukprot:gene15380-6614_t